MYLLFCAALALTEGMQWAFHHFAMFNRPELSSMLHWTVSPPHSFLIGLSLVTNYRMVRKLLYKLVTLAKDPVSDDAHVLNVIYRKPFECFGIAGRNDHRVV